MELDEFEDEAVLTELLGELADDEDVEVDELEEEGLVLLEFVDVVAPVVVAVVFEVVVFEVVVVVDELLVVLLPLVPEVELVPDVEVLPDADDVP